MSTTWTYEGYWTAVIGALTTGHAAGEFGLDPSDVRGLDEWLGLAEAEAWRVGGDGGELPESWAEFHARALAAMSEVQSRAQGAHAAEEHREWLVTATDGELRAWAKSVAGRA